MDIPIHPLSSDPTAAWKEISKTQQVIEVTMEPPQSEVAFNKVRVVCMSDTHSLTPYIPFDIPNGDIFIHAGDFTNYGRLNEVAEFNNWLSSLPHKHKIVIAGNHELSFDPTNPQPLFNERTKPTSGKTKENTADACQTQNIREVLTNCTYLEDELIEIWGIRIYGTPWQPEFGKWAFNLPRGQPCLEKWNQIPSNIDILVTHAPPVGHGDLCRSGARAGCVELLSTIQKRVKPKYHVFGHIHEGYGITSDGQVTYVNASTSNCNSFPKNPPIVLDITLPPGFHKDE